MELFGRSLDRKELHRHVGNVRQAGGVQLIELQEGMERGVRILQFSTGTGFRFGISPERGFDVAFCEYAGASLAWLPPKGFVDPAHFEGGNYGWLRVSGLGGLFNTCGLVTIGNQQELDVSHYKYMARKTELYGIHDRIGITPAERFTFGEGWQGERYVLWAEATVRQEIEYGENLVLRRRYETELGADSFRMTDVVVNDGSYETPHQILYHINAGWPLVDQGSELIAGLAKPATHLFGGDPNDPDRYRKFVAPTLRKEAEGYQLDIAKDGRGWAAAAVVNRGFRNGGGLGLFVRYATDTLPVFIEWRMMAEQLYAVGMEPASNGFGSIDELKAAPGSRLMLQPGEERRYELEIGALGGTGAIAAFEATLPNTRKGR
jgi:hypothetical protein